MKKKQKERVIRSKENVTLRYKELSNGNKSLYLDIYDKGERSYEFLKLYLLPELTGQDKQRNQEVLTQAEIFRLQRSLNILLPPQPLAEETPETKVSLTDWLHTYSLRKKEKGQSEAFSLQIDKTSRHLANYKKEETAIEKVDKDFCIGFIHYLKEGQLSNATIAAYFRCLNCALNAAVKDSLILMNPILLIPSDERIKLLESTREFLTIEEIKQLMQTVCKCEEIKRAYLFSCLSGLRLSDIKRLCWANVNKDGDQWRVSILMKKTQRFLHLPLSDEAVIWLPDITQANLDTSVFQLPNDSQINAILRKWVMEAGINKHITFHTARHTYATLLLTVGVDIYTVSKLLGHSQVKTTQIYAKIIDQKKDKAVNRIPKFQQT
ncbi:site-specific integrase [Bacteroides congonensis]|uniref:site-specific integrase n=1 Tax=Bacteroides congonensis TaxID=1871006 RepID=UPI002FD91F7D